MKSKEKKLINIYSNWSFYIKKLDDLKEKVKSTGYSLTACYGDSPSCSSIVSSKIERYCIEKDSIEKEIYSIVVMVQEAINAFKKAELTELERRLIRHIMNGYNLSSFAREEKIYISNVYKIRNRAIAKIAIYYNLKTTNRG